MLPASTTWRNRLRSARSKRMAFLRIRRRDLTSNADCSPHFPASIFAPSEASQSVERTSVSALRDALALVAKRVLSSRIECASSLPRSGELTNGRRPRRLASGRLSPHLSIYKPMLTMMMSIVHRITGCGPLFRHAASGLVADRGGLRSQRLCGHRIVHELVVRPVHPVRLHLGADPPHAGRHPPSSSGTSATASVRRSASGWRMRTSSARSTLTVVIWVIGYL